MSRIKPTKKVQSTSELLSSANNVSFTNEMPDEDAVNAAVNGVAYGGKEAAHQKPTTSLNNETHATSKIKSSQLNEITANSDSFQVIDTDLIDPYFFGNVRNIEKAKLAVLTGLIKKCGKNIQPVIVRPHPEANSKFKYQIISGRRRLKACSNCGFKVHAVVRNIDDREGLLVATHENASSLDFTIYESAAQLKMLTEYAGITFDETLDIFNASVNSNGKPVKRTAGYEILKLPNTPSFIVDIINDGRSMTLNVGSKILKAYLIILDKKGVEIGEQFVRDSLVKLPDEVSSKELLKHLNSFLFESGEQVPPHAADEYFGKSIKNNSGEVLFSVNGANKDTPSIKFTTNVKPEQIANIIKLVEEELNK
ncbi:MAG: ParB/RepB/Spo0J family partition protein [Endozoicomonadaceae bacterium]|nr:ParB/RepB/Spo0J family partition protein [Endozoicomonadaceae bacterium]